MSASWTFNGKGFEEELLDKGHPHVFNQVTTDGGPDLIKDPSVNLNDHIAKSSSSNLTTCATRDFEIKCAGVADTIDDIIDGGVEIAEYMDLNSCIDDSLDSSCDGSRKVR